MRQTEYFEDGEISLGEYRKAWAELLAQRVGRGGGGRGRGTQAGTQGTSSNGIDPTHRGFLGRLDANRDGSISIAEIAERVKAAKMRMHRALHLSLRLAPIDLNKDGWLDLSKVDSTGNDELAFLLGVAPETRLALGGLCGQLYGVSEEKSLSIESSMPAESNESQIDRCAAPVHPVGRAGGRMRGRVMAIDVFVIDATLPLLDGPVAAANPLQEESPGTKVDCRRTTQLFCGDSVKPRPRRPDAASLTCPEGARPPSPTCGSACPNHQLHLPLSSFLGGR